MHRVLGGYAVLLVAAWFSRVAMAVEPSAPIVAGFERFGRHEAISADMSGSLLIAELSCTACHPSSRAELQPKAGPKLEAVGRRINTAWMALYLRNPSDAKPGTTMPDVLSHLPPEKKERAILALTAFLSSQQAALPDLKASGANPVPHEFWKKGDPETGRTLFHQVGCVACHEPAADYEGGVKTLSTIDQLLEQLEPEELAEMGLGHAMRSVPSIPLAGPAPKYTASGLAHFLLEPSTVRPAGRMPNFKLGPVDAANIAAYLMSSAPVAPGSSVSGSAVQGPLLEEGRRLFAEVGCSNCHSVAGAGIKTIRKPLAALKLDSEHGCLSPSRAANVVTSAPHFALDLLQRQSIQAALKADAAKTQVLLTANARLQFALMQLNCYACHERDKLGGIARGRDRYFETVGQVDIGDEGRLPPPLTGVGRKLHANWLKQVFQGNGDIRPHLQIRMPKYPGAEVEPLIPLLAAADSVPSSALVSQPSTDPKLAEAGRTLFNLGCVQCHPVRGESLPSVVGVDVGKVGNRLRRDWFHDFLINPAQLKPRTRMPTFFAAGSVNQEILNGDVEQQVTAIWTYLDDIANQPLPDKLEQLRRQNFELVPSDRPIVLRTFMEQAGTHAIAVGFPEKVNLAFDAELVRLAEVWRGRFLDAQGTWNDRFTPPASPLSMTRAGFDRAPEFAELKSLETNWPVPFLSTRGPSSGVPNIRFLGYRLDGSGTPTFRYQLNETLIEDRFSPTLLVDPDGSGPNPASSSGSANQSALRGLVREVTITRPIRPEQGILKQENIAPEKKSLMGSGLKPEASQLWFCAATSSKRLVIQGATCVTDSNLQVTLAGNWESVAVTKDSGGKSRWLVPIPHGVPSKLIIEYRW